MMMMMMPICQQYRAESELLAVCRQRYQSLDDGSKSVGIAESRFVQLDDQRQQPVRPPRVQNSQQLARLRQGTAGTRQPALCRRQTRHSLQP